MTNVRQCITLYIAILLVLLFSISSYAGSVDLSVQLHWKHQFEFAGFYAAKEKGYYHDVGLNVVFHEHDESTKDLVRQVINQERNFAIWGAGLFERWAKGAPITLLANYFKRSPRVLITQPDIKFPSDLRNKKLMISDIDAEGADYQSMLSYFGISPQEVTIVKPSYDIYDFINGDVDAYLAFLTNEPYYLKKEKKAYNVFDMNNYGVEMYDINLFTSQGFVEENPLVVSNFVSATNKGWEYALRNPEEIVDLILKKYNSQQKTRDALLFEAKEVAKVILADVYPVGSINEIKVRKIVDLFLETKKIKANTLDYKQFLFTSQEGSISLTSKEKEFIHQHPIIYLGTSVGFDPFTIENFDGSVSGHDVELLNIIGKKTGLKFDVTLGKDWSKMQHRIMKKEFDGMLSAGMNKERKKHYLSTDPYLRFTTLVITKKGNPDNLETLNDLDHKTVAIQKGNTLFEGIIKDLNLDIKVLPVDSIQEMMTAVVSNQADFTILDETAFYVAKQMGLSEMIQAPLSIGDPFDIMFLFRNDYPELTSIVNKGLRSIDEGAKVALRDKWFSLKHSKNINLNLTESEKIYLERKVNVKMCVDPNWMPLEGLDKNGQHVGVTSDFFKIISERTNINFELVPTINWSQSYEFALNDRCELISLMTKNSDRDKFWNFTEPYMTLPFVIATKTEQFFVEDSEVIANKTVSMVKDYAYISVLKNRYENIQIVEVENIAEGLKLVSSGKVFGFIDTAATIAHAVAIEGFVNIKISGKLEDKWKLSIASVKEEPLLSSIMQKALDSLSEQEKEQITNRWHTIRVDEGISPKTIIQILLMMLIVVAWFLYWNMKLKKKVHKGIEDFKLQEIVMLQQSKQAAMGEVVSAVAHQWKQPLNVLSLIQQQISMKVDKSDESQQYLSNATKMMDDQIAFMSDSIDDFRNFTSPVIKSVDFDVTEAVQQLVDMFKDIFIKQRINISIQHKGSMLLHGNPNDLKHVILNIINNVKDVVEQDGLDDGHILIDIVKSESHCEIRIEDNVGGIPEDLLPEHLFDPYVSTKGDKGTGIGLHICKTIVENKFGGQLEVKNSSAGALFSITIPFARNN